MTDKDWHMKKLFRTSFENGGTVLIPNNAVLLDIRYFLGAYSAIYEYTPGNEKYMHKVTYHVVNPMREDPFPSEWELVAKVDVGGGVFGSFREFIYQEVVLDA